MVLGDLGYREARFGTRPFDLNRDGHITVGEFREYYARMYGNRKVLKEAGR